MKALTIEAVYSVITAIVIAAGITFVVAASDRYGPAGDGGAPWTNTEQENSTSQ